MYGGEIKMLEIKKRQFSPYQIICLSGRIQEYCQKKKIAFNRYSDRLVEVLKKQQNEGADMGICSSRLQKEVDNIIKEEETNLPKGKYSVYKR